MKRIGKRVLTKRVSDFLRSNDGASIVLVTIIAVIIVVGVIVLSINSSTLLAFADKQYSKDQAYEAATSLGVTLDEYISRGTLELDDHAGEEIFTDELNGISVTAIVEDLNNNTYAVVVTADSHSSQYVFTAKYTGSGSAYMRVA